MRVWIEIFGIYSIKSDKEQFHPLMRVWIEISFSTSDKVALYVSPSYEGVD